MLHPGKVETGHKWTTKYVKWENYIGSMVGVLYIPLDYATCCDMPVGWTSENDKNRLKYQAMPISLAWEAKNMVFYTKLNAC